MSFLLNLINSPPLCSTSTDPNESEDKLSSGRPDSQVKTLAFQGKMLCLVENHVIWSKGIHFLSFMQSVSLKKWWWISTDFLQSSGQFFIWPGFAGSDGLISFRILFYSRKVFRGLPQSVELEFSPVSRL